MIVVNNETELRDALDNFYFAEIYINQNIKITQKIIISYKDFRFISFANHSIDGDLSIIMNNCRIVFDGIVLNNKGTYFIDCSLFLCSTFYCSNLIEFSKTKIQGGISEIRGRLVFKNDNSISGAEMYINANEGTPVILESGLLKILNSDLEVYGRGVSSGIMIENNSSLEIGHSDILAKSDIAGAGICVCPDTDKHHIKIYDSKVTAYGGRGDIVDGKSYASGAGIGTGTENSDKIVSGTYFAQLQIYNSIIYAVGGSGTDMPTGAGIGGSGNMNQGEDVFSRIELYQSIIEAISGNGKVTGAGIGGGGAIKAGGSIVNLLIRNSTVTSKSGSGSITGSGIGGGGSFTSIGGDANYIRIENSVIDAVAGSGTHLTGAGIGGGSGILGAGKLIDFRSSCSTIEAIGGNITENENDITASYDEIEEKDKKTGAGIGNGGNSNYPVQITLNECHINAMGGLGQNLNTGAGIGSGARETLTGEICLDINNCDISTINKNLL